MYFQNAVRIALALAAGRLIVGALDLSHGLWALLATITVMGTSASGTRTALWPAFGGTLAGAAVTAVMLYSWATTWHVAPTGRMGPTGEGSGAVRNPTV
ncbi:FUSC family protein [Streptomyces sp. NBC_00053]|uniref:FUSC family protein n=1 Tax=unclassified Streptomyces TaxID=2593676 RepID=UPI000F5BD816|nr:MULTISPECIES: FUSC family protein [unclassified Streptomyces]WSG55368.1 FUSC family protein [Streptomyces sp. NBC_01732]WSX06504.1 FUSC family protein [Streptomyces sp. NBC_00987]MCX4391623.1 FUSC family protein [Streptomyces sp. NBC_01767]MCX5103264.1 FUSC family protein [Streptomyces sp. NBC_00439]MCX5165201.1 FUSC family protein [Streptomyces sp. NBC_00305]